MSSGVWSEEEGVMSGKKEKKEPGLEPESAFVPEPECVCVCVCARASGKGRGES